MSDIRIRVLKNKKTGKSASRSDAQYLANVMHLLSLKRSGRATGIATLQPTMTQQLQRKINHVSKLYRLDWIVPRKSRLAAGARRCLSSRSIRAMMLKLYFEYEDTLKSKNKSYRAPKTLKRFLDWVVDSQKDHKSPLSMYLRLNAPHIYYKHSGHPRTRGRRWWAEQLSKHRI
jgi:hypothetical protein